MLDLIDKLFLRLHFPQPLLCDPPQQRGHPGDDHDRQRLHDPVFGTGVWLLVVGKTFPNAPAQGIPILCQPPEPGGHLQKGEVEGLVAS